MTRSTRSSSSVGSCGRTGGATAPPRPISCATAERDYEALVWSAASFDEELMADLARCGGDALRAHGGARLSPGPGGLRPGGRRQQTAAVLPQGEQQQRLRRHGRRDLSGRAAVPADGADLRQGPGRAGLDLQHIAAMEVPIRPSRRRRLSPGQRPGLRRRRIVDERSRHDAGRGERQPDLALRRDRQDGRQRLVRRRSGGRS